MIEISYTQMLVTFVGALITGVMSGFGGAWVAIRVLGKEVEWINKTLEKHDKSIDRLHTRITDHVSLFHARGPSEGGE